MGRRAPGDDGPTGAVRRGTSHRQRAREGQRDLDGGGRSADLGAAVRRCTSPCAGPGPASRARGTPYAWLSTTAARRRSSGCTWSGGSMPSSRCRCSTARCTTSTGASSGSPTSSTWRPASSASTRARTTRTGSVTARTWSGRRSSATTAWSSSRSSVATSRRRQLVVDRMRNARARAKFLPPESRAWTLEPPPWRPRPETVARVPRPHGPRRPALALLTVGVVPCGSGAIVGTADPGTARDYRRDRALGDDGEELGGAGEDDVEGGGAGGGLGLDLRPAGRRRCRRTPGPWCRGR